MLADLREDGQFNLDYPGACTISTEQGQELKKKIGALAYVECSSKTQEASVMGTTEPQSYQLISAVPYP
ncbi:hypothetical protein K2173_013550 [Erythroxylum novogranatense]|uniref:Uncharacterized protein n=1 Tax=Erythroxylum novogranatense TaxID=1862640 RepID=A0AAV8TLP2_9ROSI|nr:hypothetical protein K2173_013550 [Erythroxylum novogranatense]